MVTSALSLLVALLATLAVLPVLAAPQYGGAAGSTNGGGYILNAGSSAPFRASKADCGNNACVSTAIAAGPAGIGAAYEQSGSGNFISAGRGAAGAWAQGEVLVIAQVPGGPAFVDSVLRLSLGGSTVVEAVGVDAKASGGVSVSVDGPTFGAAAYMKEYRGVNVDVGPNEYVGITRDGGGALNVPMRITLGQPFSLRLTVEAFGSATGFGSAAVRSRWNDTLTLAAQGPVFDLPAGYAVQSTDWLIEDNRWCPTGCPPVPEPSSWAMWLFGVLILTGAIRRSSAPGRGPAELPRWLRLAPRS